MPDIQGLLFDKDGTLFDFHATWGAWTAGLIDHLARGAPGGPDPARAALAQAMGYDLAARAFRKDSKVIAGALSEVLEMIAPHLPHLTPAEIVATLHGAGKSAPQVPAANLPALLDGFLERGLTLGVATNDSEDSARAHLAAHGVLDRFGFVAGYDSGHGAKPAPGMARAFLAATGLSPDRVAMVGDSTHDMATGRAAGLWRVAVLTGPADAADLAPHADAVLPSIADLPAWLAQG